MLWENPTRLSWYNLIVNLWFGEKNLPNWTLFQHYPPYGCWTKNRGVWPQIIHFNRVFHYYTIHFGVFPPYFWKETPIWGGDFLSSHDYHEWENEETSKVLRGELEESTGLWLWQFHTGFFREDYPNNLDRIRKKLLMLKILFLPQPSKKGFVSKVFFKENLVVNHAVYKTPGLFFR